MYLRIFYAALRSMSFIVNGKSTMTFLVQRRIFSDHKLLVMLQSILIQNHYVNENSNGVK